MRCFPAWRVSGSGIGVARAPGGCRSLGLGAPLLPALCRALRKENSGVTRGPSNANPGLITFGVCSLRTSLARLATSLRLLLRLGFFKASAFDGGQGAGCRWPPALLEGGLAGRAVCWGGDAGAGEVGGVVHDCGRTASVCRAELREGPRELGVLERWGWGDLSWEMRMGT